MSIDFIDSINIHSYQFSIDNTEEYLHNKYMANNWPIVYILKNERLKEAYIGESINAINRMKQHLSSEQRRRLNSVIIISCDKFNKSAVLDIESQLISYMDADKAYALQNGNAGLVNHNYYQKSQYRSIFKGIWQKLLEQNYAKQPINRLDNSNFFKYSPYKSLSQDQNNSVIEILQQLNNKEKNTIIVEGAAGTGKTILAVYLVKLLITDIQDYHLDDEDETYSEQIRNVIELSKRFPNPKVALVIPMTSLRETLKKVFRNVRGLKGNMVIGPNDVSKNKYDILLVDEAHRLKQRKALTGYKAFDDANRRLGLDVHLGTQLDWILMQSQNQIFFYDESQSIKPTDIDKSRFDDIKVRSNNTVKLVSQHRVKGGLDYISYVEDLLNCRLNPSNHKFTSETYEFKIFDSFEEMRNDIRQKDKTYQLCRIIAGFSWPWISKNDKNALDITIEGLSYQWNTEHIDWINSVNAVNEIGCIHTSQGYDLNYCGIILGNEITYNPITNSIEIDETMYFDAKGKSGIKDPNELKEYILNIYKTMMLRGILGTYIYVCNKELRTYMSKFIKQ